MKHPSDIEDLPVLPPGMDQISQTTFGHLTLEIGKILSFKDKHYQKEDIRVRAKFWGEQGPGKIYRVLNANGQMIQRYPNKRVYKVCCQMEQFYKYLEDMSKLHLTLIDKTDKSIGFSVIDISSNLKPSLGFGEFSPLEQDNQILAIYSKNKKEQIEIGQLEANISCEFDPNLSQFLHEYPQSSTSTFTQIKGSEEEMTKKGPQGKKEDIKIRNEIFQEVGQDEDGKENKNINKDESQQRVALSLFEAKKEKLEYQSKKFLDKVENKISIGNELLNDIWVNEDYEEEEVKVINPLVFKNEVKKNDRNNKTLLEDILSEKDEETDRQPYSKNNFEDINKYKNQEDISLSCRTDQLESPEDYLPQQPIDKQKEEEREDQLKKVNMDDQLEFKQLDQQFSLSGINHLKNLEQKVDRLLSVGQMIFKDNQQKMNGGEEDDGDEELAVPYFSDLPKKIIQKNQEKKVSNNTKVSSNLNQNKDHPKQLIEYNIPQAQEIHSRIFQQQQQSINSSHLQETIELKLPKNDSLPSPLSEHFKQASRWESLELTVLEFNCLHDHLLSKFKQRNIFLACDVPSSFSSKSPPLRDSYKEINGEEFIFKQKFTIAIKIDSIDSFQIFKDSTIQVTLNSFILPQADTDKRVMMQMAKGEFKLSKILNQNNFSGNFYVNLSSNLPLNESQSRNNQSQSSEPVIVSISKKDAESSSLHSQMNVLGQIKIHISLIQSHKDSEISQVGTNNLSFNQNTSHSTQKSRSISQIHPQKTTGEFIDRAISSSSHQNTSCDLQIGQMYNSNIQIFLRLERLRVFGLSSYSTCNFFARYKIYGSPEQIQSEIQWNNPEPDLKHRMNMPCSLESLRKMLRLPLLIEVWNKQERGEDQIIGIVTISLASIPRTCLLPDFSNINPNWLATSNQQIIILQNENMPVREFINNKDKAQLFVAVAFGSPQQISKFDSNLSEQWLMLNQSRSMQGTIQPSIQTQSNLTLKNSSHLHTKNHNQPLHQQQQQYTTISSNRSHSNQQNSSQISDRHFSSPGKTILFQDEEEINRHLKQDISSSNSEISNKNDIIESMSEVMLQLNNNLPKIQLKLKEFVQNNPQESTIENKQFVTFIQGLELKIKASDLGNTLKLLDFENKGEFRVEYFTRSFTSAQRYEGNIKRKYQKVLEQLLEVMEQSKVELSHLDRELRTQSEFGMMRKEKFANLMRKMGLIGENISELVEEITELLDAKSEGLLFVSSLKDYLENIEVYGEIKKIQMNYQWIHEEFKQELKKLAPLSNEALLQKNSGSPFIIQNIMTNFSISLWEAAMLIQLASNQKSIITTSQFMNLDPNKIINWISQLQNKKIGIPTSKLTLLPQQQQLYENSKKKDLIQETDEIDFLSGVLNENQNQKISHPIGEFDEYEQKEVNHYQHYQKTSPNKQTTSKQVLQNNSSQQLGQVMYSIELKICKIMQLQFDEGIIRIFCKVGSDSSRVEAKKLVLDSHQKTYDVNYTATKTYKLTQNEDIANILQFEKVTMQLDLTFESSDLQLYQNSFRGELSTNSLSEVVSNVRVTQFGKHSQNMQIQIKDNYNNNIAGIIEVIVTVQKKQLQQPQQTISSSLINPSQKEECLVEKETTVQKLLPKQGYLNFAILSQRNLNTNYSQTAMSNFLGEIKIKIDLFHEHSYLKTMFGSQQSTSNKSSINQQECNSFQGSIQMSMTSEILGYFKENTCLIELLKQEKVIGQLQVPLLDLLIQQNITLLDQQIELQNISFINNATYSLGVCLSYDKAKEDLLCNLIPSEINDHQLPSQQQLKVQINSPSTQNPSYLKQIKQENIRQLVAHEFSPLNIEISQIKLLNGSLLLDGGVPNIIMECGQLNYTSACYQRESNPTIQTNLKGMVYSDTLDIKLYHRTYSSNLKQSLYTNILIGSATFKVQELLHTQSKQFQLEVKQESQQKMESQEKNNCSLLISASLVKQNQQEYTLQKQSQSNSKITKLVPSTQESQQKDNSFDEGHWNQPQEIIDNFHKTMMEIQQRERDEMRLNDSPEYSSNLYEDKLKQTEAQDLLFLETMNQLDKLKIELQDAKSSQSSSHIPQRDLESSKREFYDLATTQKNIESVQKVQLNERHIKEEEQEHEQEEEEEEHLKIQESFEDYEALRETLKHLTQNEEENDKQENHYHQVRQNNKDEDDAVDPLNFKATVKNNSNSNSKQKTNSRLEQEYVSFGVSLDNKSAHNLPSNLQSKYINELEEVQLSPFKDQDIVDQLSSDDDDHVYNYSGSNSKAQKKNHSFSPAKNSTKKEGQEELNYLKEDKNENKFYSHYSSYLNSQKFPSQSVKGQLQFSDNFSEQKYSPTPSAILPQNKYSSNQSFQNQKDSKNRDDNSSREQSLSPKQKKYEQFSTLQQSPNIIKQQPDSFRDNKYSSNQKEVLFSLKREDSNERVQREGILQRKMIEETKNFLGQNIKKPPISQIKKKEEIQVKNSEEIKRISNILKQDYSREKKYFDLSSDDDDSDY